MGKNINFIDWFRLGIAVLIAKTVTLIVRSLGLGGASLLPGSIARPIEPLKGRGQAGMSSKPVLQQREIFTLEIRQKLMTMDSNLNVPLMDDATIYMSK